MEAKINLEPNEKSGPELGVLLYGISIITIVLVISLAVWYLIGDPKVSIFKLYPQPFGAVMFWAILCVVFLGFNGEMWPFNDIRQPQAGILALIFTAVIDLIVIVFLNYVYGAMDPTFSPKAGGTGWVATGMIVLFGFYAYGVHTNSMDHWPWKDLGLKQPAVGIIEVFLGSLITLVLYLLLMYPNLAAWTTSGKALMSLPTAVGWFYSVIVCWLTTALLWENWPWSKFGSRASVAICSFIGNFLGGTAIYFIFMYLLKGYFIPHEAQKLLAGAITLWPAHLGVIIVAWILVWCLVFQNYPKSYGLIATLFLRTAIVYNLGFITFIVYTRWFGPLVLHEPAISANFGGDPLNYMDLFNLVLLIYVVYFGTWPLALRIKD